MICAICNAEEVTSTNPETDFCRSCFYNGRAAERELRPLLDRLSEAAEAPVSVWHTGGGCFNLAITLADETLLTPSVGYANDEDGTIWPEPGFPDEAEGEKWSLVIAENEQAWSEWDESKLTVPQALYTADELVEKVRELAKAANS